MKDNLKEVWFRVRRWLFAALILCAFFVLVVLPIFTVLFSHNQMEAKTCLIALINAEIAHYGEHSGWSESFKKIAWSPTEPAYYAYFLSPTEYVGRSPEELGLSVPVDFNYYDAPTPGQTDDGFIAVAIGNVDFDNSLDVWWVDQNKVLTNVQDDVSYWSTLLDIITGNW